MQGLLAIALLAWALTLALEAQPESAHYGLSIGKLDYSARAAGLAAFNGSTDSWRVTIGYQFLKNFAFEGGYGKTSTVRDTASRPGPPPSEFRF
jgi:hypothetical protein